MRLAATVVGLVLLGGAGCASEDEVVRPETAGLSGIRASAELGEATWGVPADLVLAVAYAETRWQLPEGDDHADHHGGHAPEPVGIGGLRPWLEPDAVGLAERALGATREQIAASPELGILAAAAVLRDLAARRFGDADALPADPVAWREVIADYAGLDGDEARASYAADVYRYLERGVRARAADGSMLTLRSRPIAFPEAVAARRAAGGAEYPGAIWSPAHSENYASGRAGQPIRYIVIHTMQGSYAGAISWFRNPASGVSAHYCIRSSDGEVTQMLRESDTGWHAGNRTYNQQGIGIEHEGFVADPGRWYTDAMYRSSAALTRHLADKYGIPIDREHILGHVEVPGATHTDPGTGWDWDRFMSLVRGEPPRPPHAASFVGQDHPREMTSGERAVAWIEMRNDGSATWDLTNTRIGTTMPQDHPSPFHDVENWINDHRPSAADHSDYGPGAVGRFTFMITAPEVATDTTIRDTFGLVQEGVAWFGPEDITFEILVHPRVVTPTDLDGDGSAAGADCDDGDAGRFPGAVEVCGNGLDDDCDGSDLGCTDPTDPGPTDPGPTDPGPDDPADPGPGDPTDPGPEDPGPAGSGRPGAGGALSGGCSSAGSAPGSTAGWIALGLGAALCAARRRRR